MSPSFLRFPAGALALLAAAEGWFAHLPADDGVAARHVGRMTDAEHPIGWYAGMSASEVDFKLPLASCSSPRVDSNQKKGPVLHAGKQTRRRAGALR